jgi:flagellar biosynthetic protein FliO
MWRGGLCILILIFSFLILYAQEDTKSKPTLEDPAPKYPGSPSEGAQEREYTPGLVNVFLWTIFVCALIIGSVWFLRKILAKTRLLGPGGMMKVLAYRPLTSKHTLFIVEVGRRILLIGVAKESIHLLAEFRDQEDMDRIKFGPRAVEKSIQEGFRQSLRDSLQNEPEETDPDQVYQTLTHIKKTIRGWQR